MSDNLNDAIRKARFRSQAMTITGTGEAFNTQIRRLAGIGTNVAALELEERATDAPQPDPVRYAAGSGDGGKQSPPADTDDLNDWIRRAADRGRW